MEQNTKPEIVKETIADRSGVLSHDVTCGRCEKLIRQGEAVANDDIYGPVHAAGCTEP